MSKLYLTVRDGVTYQINREHPLIAELFEMLDDSVTSALSK